VILPPLVFPAGGEAQHQEGNDGENRENATHSKAEAYNIKPFTAANITEI
jgi:hypothetical protein